MILNNIGFYMTKNINRVLDASVRGDIFYRLSSFVSNKVWEIVLIDLKIPINEQVYNPVSEELRLNLAREIRDDEEMM